MVVFHLYVKYSGMYVSERESVCMKHELGEFELIK